jgi:hypothetical protein
MTAVALLGLFLLWQIYQRNNVNRTAQPVAAEPQAAATTPAPNSAPLNSNAKLAAPNGSVPMQGPGAAGSAAPVSPDPAASGAAVATAATNPVPSAAEAASTNATIAAQPEPPKPAPLTLQGIVFNPRRPSVVINGRTLFVGDRIGQFRVAAIHPDSTVLIGAGRTNLLSLDQ